MFRVEAGMGAERPPAAPGRRNRHARPNANWCELVAHEVRRMMQTDTDSTQQRRLLSLDRWQTTVAAVRGDRFGCTLPEREAFHCP